MTPRKLRQLLTVATIGCWLLACSLIAMALLFPLPKFASESSRSARKPNQPTVNALRQPPAMDDLASLVTLKLQQPIYDPPPPVIPPEAPPPPPPPPQLQLVATMRDPTGDQAMIKDASGKTRFAKIGDRLNGGSGEAELTAISDAAVTVESGGQTFEITLRP